LPLMGTRIGLCLQFGPLIASLQRLVSAGNGVTHSKRKMYKKNSTHKG